MNGLPVVTEDLRITSPDPAVTRFITRDFDAGTPEFRLLEPPACELTTTRAYDALETIIGWTGATTSTLTLDAASLIKR